ncbi:MAG: hypothetical protein C0507_05830 [Cyanobacteria bacterium PR.3.49]|nr:hypothetical protein [Cyanobacteria bacterium PR.3.49]
MDTYEYVASKQKVQKRFKKNPSWLNQIFKSTACEIFSRKSFTEFLLEKIEKISQSVESIF